MSQRECRYCGGTGVDGYGGICQCVFDRVEENKASKRED